MAYSTANPPRLNRQTPGGGGARFWEYTNTDATTVVRVAGYITNAAKLGMKIGDRVDYLKSDDNSRQLFTVAAINATTGAADLNDGLSIASTNT